MIYFNASKTRTAQQLGEICFLGCATSGKVRFLLKLAGARAGGMSQTRSDESH